MKKNVNIRPLLIISALLLLFAVSSCGVESDNIVSTTDISAISPTDSSIFPSEQEISSILYSNGDIFNNSFEDNLDGHWLIKEEDSIVIDNTYSREGSKSLKLGSDDAYDTSIIQYIDGLESGYYYLEVYTINEGNQDFCYIYGKGTMQGQCMTSVPKTIHENEWTKVTVRGIHVSDDGILEIGIYTKGEGQYVYADTFTLTREKNQTKQYESLFGGAISWLDWVEDLGGKYYRHNGIEGDAIQIMAENGCNFVRLELYNNPGDYINESGDTFPAGYKDADAIFDLAVRAHNKNMKIQLSFMYSDYWGNSAIPSDWLDKIDGITDHEEISDILSDCIYSYTKGFMERLAAAGIYPEYVSLGNEMSGGILEPYGSTWKSSQSLSAFCDFMDAGYRAVKEVSPSSRIVLHIACNADDMFWANKSGSGKWFYGLCAENNIKYDLIGISYYPYWAQTDNAYAVKSALDTADLVEWCNMMIDTFDKDILIMESGINWGLPGQLANNGAYRGIYFSTPADQRNFMYELINAIKSVKDGRCIGDLYWDPVLVRQDGVGWAIMSATNTARENCVQTTTFFDFDHVALPVLDAYRYNIVNNSSAFLYGTVTNSDGTPAAEQTFNIEFCGKIYVITTDKYGDYYTSVDAGNGLLSIKNGDPLKISVAYGERLSVDLFLSR